VNLYSTVKNEGGYAKMHTIPLTKAANRKQVVSGEALVRIGKRGCRLEAERYRQQFLL
jgi:hypothetical protein